MFALSLLLLLFSVRSGFAEDFCLNRNPCKCETKRGVIDLTSIGSPQAPRFYVTFPEKNCSGTVTEFYMYNPCFPFHYDSADVIVKEGYKPCKGAAGCIKKQNLTSSELPEEYAIGLQDSAVFYNDSKGTYVNYSVPDAKAKHFQVYLTCDKDVEHQLTMIKAECEPYAAIVLNLTSKCCCPNGCSTPLKESGLSTGSVLLIVFFTVLIAYLLVGIVWNFCNGAHGAELIPNQEFWNDLPTLIMEGVLFTCSCMRGRTYGEV